MVAANEARGVAIDSRTVIPMWTGDRLDLGWAVTSLWYANHLERLTADNAADRAAGRVPYPAAEAAA